MAQHTPGSWHRNIKPASHYPTIFAGEAPKHVHVAHVCSRGMTESEIEANCDLITAAPDLLAACELALKNCEARIYMFPVNSTYSDKQALETEASIYRAAIARARGEG